MIVVIDILDGVQLPLKGLDRLHWVSSLEQAAGREGRGRGSVLWCSIFRAWWSVVLRGSSVGICEGFEQIEKERADEEEADRGDEKEWEEVDGELRGGKKDPPRFDDLANNSLVLKKLFDDGAIHSGT